MKTLFHASSDAVTLKASGLGSLPDTLDFCRNMHANSYKFSKPRIYVKNNFESESISTVNLLKDLSLNYGSKTRPESYDTYILQMQGRNSKKTKLFKGKVSLNLNNTLPVSMRMLTFEINLRSILALADTGSSHCLMSVDTYMAIGAPELEPLKVVMHVAGATLKDNIIGRLTLDLKFNTLLPSQITYSQEFLVAYHINGYQAIIGADFLFNPNRVVALTPEFILLHTADGPQNVPFSAECKEARRPVDFNWLTCPNLLARANSKVRTEFMATEADISQEDYSEELSHYYSEPEFTTDIDDESAEEIVVVDPTNLDKKFSYKDCEVNTDLPAEYQTQLWEVLKKHKKVFATSKLDVGTFKGFLVQIEIEKNLAPEPQRYLSPEKIDYCKKTFQTFEKLDLIRECNNPKTISNLHLVPKYEGLRDLTKASTYLAQIRGEKNYTFRIVQDLRRINSHTKNVRKSHPVLPESIFSRMQNKIVSSIDANQAYWHLVLDPASRPWTCFYLGKKVYQYNRMAQGLMNSPACWDKAMEIIFSPETMKRVKSEMGPKAQSLPESFDSFFAYYQDDSWVISDNHEEHILQFEAVLIAYKLHDIRISAQKTTVCPKELKVLGVLVIPSQAELALDAVKAKSILSWEKPDSLYTLQSRLYSFNYWQKFIPMLSELKFPLNQILRSGVFSWDARADKAWQHIKSLISLDIRLVIPEKHEQLVLTTDASKVAISCILWVERDGDLRVVGCYSKLFSHTDSLKSIHFKETYAMVEGFRCFRPYLLNSQKSIVVFTDARSLIWVSRNREYSIACNGLVNKLAKLQLEIPHVVYSVPSEVNYLADVFSRAYATSRFLDKKDFSLSKAQANEIPPLTDPCVLSENELYVYFSSPCLPEKSDKFSREKNKIQTPRPIKSLYKLFSDCTPEQKYYSALRLLQGWNDENLSEKDDNLANASILDAVSSTDKKAFQSLKIQFVNHIIETLYSNLDSDQKSRIHATLLENFKKFSDREVLEFLKKRFLKFESEINSISITEKLISGTREQDLTPIYFCSKAEAEFDPHCAYNSPGIDLPLQSDLRLFPGQKEVVDTKFKFFIPNDYYGQIAPRSSTAKMNIIIFPGVIDNDYSGYIKLVIRNTSDEEMFFEKGVSLAQLLIKPIAHPKLHKVESIDITSDRGAGSFGSSSSELKVDSEASGPELKLSSPLNLSNEEDGPSKGIPEIKLSLHELEPCILHELNSMHQPDELKLQEINTKIIFPNNRDLKLEIWHKIKLLEGELVHLQLNSAKIRLCNPEEVNSSHLTSMPEELLEKYGQTRPILNRYRQIKLNALNGTNRQFYEENISDMCKKLAVISVDYLKNKTITSDILARCQMSDDYLSQIYERCQENDDYFENYLIQNKVLYKRIWDPNLNIPKYCIVIPDILLPSIVHSLHHLLAHPSISTTRRNFWHYYYNRKANQYIAEYVRSCMTCNVAGKIDVKKLPTGVQRTMVPTAPRQCMYIDLLHCPKGRFQYILFCVDAYSQYLMTVPLIDRSSASVLQAILSVFSSVGSYSKIYFDNEPSFASAAKILCKILPVEIHYSVPYAHFQNSAETHIKLFKKCFLKALYDDDSNLETVNPNWDLLLPTVTQAVNRQLVLSLGLTRETLHFNMPSSYYPLAHIDDECQNNFQDAFDIFHDDHFSRLVEKRLRKNSRQNRVKIPTYFEGQLVMVKSQVPETGTSLFKVPYKGPFRITKIEPRNIDLVELESGKEHTAHMEFLKPLSLKEFRMVLHKNLLLHRNIEKRIRKTENIPVLDHVNDPYPLEQIFALENESFVDPGGTEMSSDSEPPDLAVIAQSGEEYTPPTNEDPLEGPSNRFYSLDAGRFLPLSKKTQKMPNQKRVKFLTKVRKALFK